MTTIEALREKLAAKQTNGGKSFQSGVLYPFSKVPVGQQAVVRFLPDGNKNNDLFWQENIYYRLPFPGIEGERPDENRGTVFVNVPCPHQWKGDCPIFNEIQPIWKSHPNEEQKNFARRYTRKREYYYNVLVCDNPLTEEGLPESPVRRIRFYKALHQKVLDFIGDKEVHHLPTDYDHGVDFRIKVTKNGQWNSYDTSDFSRSERALSDGERKSLEHFGLHDLSECVYRRPDEEGWKAVMEMFRASANDEYWDPKWAQYYKPANYKGE